MSTRKLRDLKPSERIELAKVKTQKLVDHAIHLLNLHEAVQIVAYSSALSKQIPRSHAANAFNIFRDAFYKFEIIRLCVLWDDQQEDDLDTESIPAVVQLTNDPAVLDQRAGPGNLHRTISGVSA